MQRLLTTETSDQGMAGWTGLEPATSDVTGRRSNQLNYHPAKAVEAEAQILVGGTGFEPVAPGLPPSDARSPQPP